MTFTIAQVLDLLMLLVLAMFVPIGLWRGVLREWVALAGITIGGLLAAEWAGPWGGDLANQTGLEPKLAAFIVGAAFFLGATLLIGYGGGAALPYRPDLSRANRLLGALLGLSNGVLILSGILRIMQRQLFEDRTDSLLLGTGFSRFLIVEVGWAQLLILATLGLCVLVSLVRRWLGAPPLMEEFAPAYLVAEPSRAVEPEDAWEPLPADDLPATEPAPLAPNANGGEPQQETAILHLVPPATPQPRPDAPRPITPAAVRPADAVSSPAPARPATLVSVPKVVELARPARATPRPASAPIANGETSPPAAPVAPATPAPPVELASVGVTCAVCGNLASARSRFCQSCGHIIGEAERRRVARTE